MTSMSSPLHEVKLDALIVSDPKPSQITSAMSHLFSNVTTNTAASLCASPTLDCQDYPAIHCSMSEIVLTTSLVVIL